MIIETYHYDGVNAPDRFELLAEALIRARDCNGAIVQLHWSTGRGRYTVHADRAGALAELDAHTGPPVPGSMGEHGMRTSEIYVDLTPDGPYSESWIKIVEPRPLNVPYAACSTIPTSRHRL